MPLGKGASTPAMETKGELLIPLRGLTGAGPGLTSRSAMKTITAFLCALALTPLAAFAAEYGEISHDELKAAIKEKKVTLLDVNGSDSYKQGHIPGALDFTTAKKELKAKLPADKNALVVAYCGNENCGAYAAGAKAAQELGYTNVKHYKPGIAGWKAKGEKTDKDS